MKEILAICILVLAYCSTASAQFPKQVEMLDVKINSTTSVKGDLSEGQFVDLRFGMRGSVGCFTEAEKSRYNGKHRFYAFKVPANAKVLVEMTGTTDMSLYGYMISTDRFDIPPYLENVSKSGCSASAQPMGTLERIMLKASSSPMHVVIGVAGVESSENGNFNLKVTTRQ